MAATLFLFLFFFQRCQRGRLWTQLLAILGEWLEEEKQPETKQKPKKTPAGLQSQHVGDVDIEQSTA